MSTEEFQTTIQCLCRDVKQLYRLKKRFEISGFVLADNPQPDKSIVSLYQLCSDIDQSDKSIVPLEEDNNNMIVATVEDPNTEKVSIPDHLSKKKDFFF